MTDLPPIIRDYLCRRALAHRQPVYLHLDRTGNIRDGGGHLAHYDLDPLAVNQPVSAVLDFMEGILPLEDDACHLGCLQPQADVCLDAHIIPDEKAYWLLLLDTREEERQRRAMQQKANELALVREAQARLLTTEASPAAARLPTVNFDPQGDRKQVSVLVAGLRLAAGAARDTPPAALLDQLARRGRKVAAGLQAEAGLLHAHTSTTVIAIFGLVPTQADSSEQALAAALNLQRDFSSGHHGHGPVAGSILPPAIGVTTGMAVVGLEAGSDAGRLHAIGPPLQAASRLMRSAQPGQVLTDVSSFTASGDLQVRFEPITAEGDKHTGPVYVSRRVRRP